MLIVFRSNGSKFSVKTSFLLLPVALATFASHASAAISITSATSLWTAITYADPNAADPSLDQQTGTVEGDIVGNAAHQSLYTIFDDGGTPGVLTDGEIGFRLRLGGDASPSGLKTVVWVGIDANADGKVDLFAGALEDSKIGYYPAGTGANTSPSTTSITSSSPYLEVAVSTLNFDFSPVTSTNDPTASNFNLDGGSGGGASHTDQFVSFKLSFASLVTVVNSLGLSGVGTFNQNSPLRFIAATSQQANALNQDLNGINGGVNSATTWTALGGFTQPFTVTGLPAIPEPSSLVFLSSIGLLWGFRRSRA